MMPREVKLRYFPCYHDEWLVGQAPLDNACRGLYLTACLLEYSHGGPVPIDEVRRNCRDHGLAFNRQLKTLIDSGKLIENEGRIANKRVENELRKRDKRSEDGSQNAGKRWNSNGLDVEVAVPPSNANQNQNQNYKEESPPYSPPSRKRGTRLPDNWQPNAEERAFAVGRGLDPIETAAQFCDYWHAEGKTKLDWHKTWQVWCRNQRTSNKRPEKLSPVTKMLIGGRRAVDRFLEKQADRDRDDADGAAFPLLDGR